jgi:hypothetical protein
MAMPASNADPDDDPEVQVEPTVETTGFAGMVGLPGSEMPEALSPEELNAQIAAKDRKDNDEPTEADEPSNVEEMNTPGLRDAIQ